MAELAPTYRDYTVGWICALEVEQAAARALLDLEHPRLPSIVGDTNIYYFGSINGHNIVIACLPDGETGNNPVAAVATRMTINFPLLRFGLMVGIGGGVPTPPDYNDIRLGDVVVSSATGEFGGVVQYDRGKTVQEGVFTRTGSLNRPPDVLRQAVTGLRATYRLKRSRFTEYLSQMVLEFDTFASPSVAKESQDILFRPDYDHCKGFGAPTCESCDATWRIQRSPRSPNPAIHYGVIASGNQVMRNGIERDRISRELGGVLCFEMEAAGLMNTFPCLVIRGICDYSDSHKNKDWQEYAAAVAAVYAKELLGEIEPAVVERTPAAAAAMNTPKAHWLVPFQRNEHFVGRDSQLNELSAKLSSEAHCQRVAVVGLGGIGKTQIVLEFAYRKREISPDCSIFWIPAVNSGTFEQAYLQIGQLLQIPGITEKSADVKQLVKTRLSQESAGQWLLILDNADDISMLYKRAYSDNGSLALIDYLPSSCYGSIIFTTRTRKAAVKQARSNMIKVYEMDQVEAKKVLEKSLIQTHILREDEATNRLLDLLTCLPLAIVQAAAFINANGISIFSYIALYENGEDEVIELLSKDFEDQGRYKDTKNPIATTWLISFNQIRLRDQLAADYLSFMSCLVSQRIPESLLPPAQTKIKMVEAIGTLTAYSFITKREIEQSFDLHRLVHLATRNWLRKTQSLAAWTERTLSQLADVFPSGDHKQRATWTAYLPHARHILALPHLSDGNKEAEIKLLFKVGCCLDSNGQYVEAEQMHRQTLELRRKVLGPEHPDTLTSMNELASALSGQGKYVEAEQMHRQTLELRRKVLGPEHSDTLTSVNELASALSGQGKYVKAEQMHRQALELRRKVLGLEHPNTLTSMGNLGWALSRQGKYVEAERMHRQALELRRKVLGPEHPHTLTSMGWIASVLSSQGKYVEAEQMHRQTLELRRKVLGPEHPRTLTSMSWIGSVLSSQGKYVEAEQMHRQMLQLKKEAL